MSFIFNFSRDHVRALLPSNPDPDGWYDAMIEVLPLWDINTPERVAGFIAQTAHESGEYRRLSENLNYSASRLNVVFPKYFQRAGRDANAYHRQPEKIANVVYANRMGNGNTASGDGWKFRGRGIMQLTGKNNYSAFARVMDMSLDEVVDYVETKKGAVDSACWFWDSRNLNREADELDIVEMTRLINGGTHGLDDRERRWRHALQLFTDGVPTRENVQHRTVKRSSRGQTVRAVQEALDLKADGIFGPETERAVVNWQIKNGLKGDGIVGPRTLRAMLG